eukprot:5835445-Amphidinium_carterae.1
MEARLEILSDPQVTADLNTIRVWQRQLNTGTLEWPLDESIWDTAPSKGRGRGPIRHLKTLADRAGWVPHPQGWQSGEQTFTWHEADLKIKWDSARALLADVTTKRPDFAGLETGLSTQAVRHLKSAPARKTNEQAQRSTLPLVEFGTKCEPTKLSRWAKHVSVPPVLTHEPVLVNWTGVITIWTDGFGRHSDDPQHRGVGWDTIRTHMSMCGFPYLDLDMVSDCKGVVKAIQTLQAGRRTPKGRNRDLELRAMQALLPGQRIRWMTAHLKQADVDSGRVTADDFQRNQQADLLANQGTAQHGPLEPDPVWLTWQDLAMKVYHFWRL